FVVAEAGDAAPLERAVRALLERLPFFRDRPIETWSSSSAAAAWVAHAPDQTGGVSYAHVGGADSLALWSGRPFVWRGDGAADGRAPLEPGFWLGEVDLDSVDGRFAAARGIEGRGIEAFCD